MKVMLIMIDFHVEVVCLTQKIKYMEDLSHDW